MTTLAITGGTVWTATGATITGGTVLIQGRTITAVGAATSTPIPNGARVIDATGKTIIPGLIDCHVHLASNSDLRSRTTPTQFYGTTNSQAQTLHTVRNAQRALAMGFTTLRTMGHRDSGNEEVKAFSEQGLMPLPRVYLAPWPVTMTGGHGDHLRPPAEERRKFDTADGEVELRQMVRKQMAHGADFIKVFASGGVFGGGSDSPAAPNYSVAEIAALVDEAHTYNLHVAAHGHSREGIRRSIAAGVDSVEHCTFAEDAELEQMAEKGIFIVPTLTIQDQVMASGEAAFATVEARDAYRRMAEHRQGSFVRAVELGVKVAAGTDTVGGLYRYGVHARELELYVELGLKPEQALETATVRAAELLRRPDLGVLAPGASADVVVVDGDPLSDISVLRSRSNIHAVVRSGREVAASLSDLDPELA